MSRRYRGSTDRIAPSIVALSACSAQLSILSAVRSVRRVLYKMRSVCALRPHRSDNTVSTYFDAESPSSGEMLLPWTDTVEDGIHQQHRWLKAGDVGGRDGAGQKICISPLVSVPKTWRFSAEVVRFLKQIYTD